MTTATNEACIWWLHGNCYFMGEGMAILIGYKFVKGGFLVGEMSKLLAIGWDYCQIPSVSHKGSYLMGVTNQH